MEITGDYLFDAPREMVWEALLDPNVLGSIMPGGQGFEKVGENQYTGVLQIKVGPVQGAFQGQVALSDLKPPEHYRMDVDGKGAPGFVKATGSLQLEARDRQTFMAYTGQAQVGGRIASVGQRLMDSSARSIIRQSLEALNEYLKAKVAQQQAAASPPTASAPSTISQAATAAPPPATPTALITGYKPPSQTSLAVNVARDVFNDMIPAKYQPVLLGAVVVVILLILWAILRR